MSSDRVREAAAEVLSMAQYMTDIEALRTGVKMEGINAALDRLRAALAAHDDYRARYEAIVERCRTDRRPGVGCYCGCHTSEPMAAPADDAVRAATERVVSSAAYVGICIGDGDTDRFNAALQRMAEALIALAAERAASDEKGGECA